ncbi:MAG TPA: endonuclease/exonuclease/phosphatase family protein [Isosphaeraceae bacterium]|jgi:3-phytase|nr:endonuclease/exonuclease/phosphatase family protein [Isosphaeraceae bacterium]
MKRPIVLVCLLLASSITAATARGAEVVRFATFNASLNRDQPGGLVHDLKTPDSAQAKNVAEIIQRNAPDILLINEFDYDSDGRAVELFQKNYLGVSQNGAKAIVYPYRFIAEVNTGIPSGFDLDNDGQIDVKVGSRGYGNDALGFGQFPGQYGMVVYSKFPIKARDVRQFHKVLWKDMPGALLPAEANGTPWYTPQELGVLRLSSKSHWDVPIEVDGKTIHVLVSHPTPPAFDGPEHRNGKRNHDEIRLWADYLSGGAKAAYVWGPRPAGSQPPPPPESFVVMGDLNADPNDGGGVPGAIDQLLKHPRVDASLVPRSEGAAEASRLQAGANLKQTGPPEQDTADFDDRSVGNLRADYVLPSKDLKPVGGGVFWPPTSDPLSRLVKMDPAASSDHRLVYLDIQVGDEK